MPDVSLQNISDLDFELQCHLRLCLTVPWTLHTELLLVPSSNNMSMSISHRKNLITYNNFPGIGCKLSLINPFVKGKYPDIKWTLNKFVWELEIPNMNPIL